MNMGKADYVNETGKKEKRMKNAIRKELAAVGKQEERLRKASAREGSRPLAMIAAKIPPKAAGHLEKAFCKAFSVVFGKGTDMIEKGFRKDAIREDYMVRDYAVQVKGGRKELRGMESGAREAGRRNLALTAAEGIGLGIFGIGLPDIVVFTGMLLKGIYETALHYGFSYDTEEERLFILKMMETALSKGEEWEENNQTVDGWLQNGIPVPEGDALEIQADRTARAFAMDMLVLKFIQGIPVAGVLGGAGNPVYYRRVMRYVRLKYRKRYLLGCSKEHGKEERTDS